MIINDNINFLKDIKYKQNFDISHIFKYDSLNDNGYGQSEYIFNLTRQMKCDMLMVGGGGMKQRRVSKTEVFNYTGSVQDWTVPEGVKEVTAYVWGAGGSGGGGQVWGSIGSGEALYGGGGGG